MVHHNNKSSTWYQGIILMRSHDDARRCVLMRDVQMLEVLRRLRPKNVARHQEMMRTNFFGSRTWGEIMRGDRMTMHGGLAQCWTRCIAAVSKSCRIGRVTWWPRAVGSKKGASCFPFSRRAAQGGQSRSFRGRDAP